MASGLAVKLPLVTDNTFGAYNLITDYASLIKQNLKIVDFDQPGRENDGYKFWSRAAPSNI